MKELMLMEIPEAKKRKYSLDKPIIVVSARDTAPDKIAGLSLGGDVYLTKPFSPMVLIAGIKSTFRRIELDKIILKITRTIIPFK